MSSLSCAVKVECAAYFRVTRLSKVAATGSAVAIIRASVPLNVDVHAPRMLYEPQCFIGRNTTKTTPSVDGRQ